MTLRVGMTISAESSGAQAELRKTADAVAALVAKEAQIAGAARGAAAAQRELAASSGRVAGSLDDIRARYNPLFGTIRQYKTTIDAVRLAHAAGAISANEMTQAITRERQAALGSIAAIKGHNNALHGLAGANRAARQGMIQVGQQLQDISVGMASGQRAATIFAQQLPQLALALQIMGSGADGAKGKLATFSRFLSGPWGIALTVAIPLVALLAGKLFETVEASKAGEESTIDFSSSLLAQTGVVGNLTAGIQQLNQATHSLINTQALLIDNSRAAAQATVADLTRRSAAASREFAAINRRDPQRGPVVDFFLGSPLSVRDRVRRDQLQREIAETSAQLAAARRSVAEAQTAAESRDVRERANPDSRARGEIARQRARLEERRQYTIENQSSVPFGGRYDLPLISDAEFAREMAGLERREQALSRSNRAGSGGAAARRADAANARDIAYAERAEDAVARINERWGEQPSLIQQANAATRQLNGIIEDAQARLQRDGLGAAQAAALRTQIVQAQGAIDNVAAGLDRPFRDMVAASAQQMTLQRLVLAGREDEAEVMRRILDMQERMRPLSEAQRATIAGIVEQEHRINEALERREAVLGAYKQSIGDLRGALSDLLSGGSVGGFFDQIKGNIARLRGELATESLFGPQLRALEREIRSTAITTGLEPHVDALGAQIDSTASAFEQMQAAALATAASLRGVDTGAATTALDGGALGDPSGDLGAIADSLKDIVVIAGRDETSLGGMKPGDYIDRMAAIITRPLLLGLEQLDKTLGTKIAGPLGGVISGAVGGYLRAGKVGAVLGGLDGLKIGGKIGKGVSKALGGAEYGGQIAQLGKSLGLKTSTTGGQIGGALGALAPIPGGKLIGSIIGSLVGGLFKKTPHGAAVLSSATGDAAISGNKAAARDAVGSLAGSVQGGLQQIADQLGGVLGAFSVSVGSYKDSFRVSASGSGKVGDKKYPKEAGADLLYDGKDADAAVRAAILNAIADGGIAGLSRAVQKALQSSPDIDKAMREALKVREVEEILGGIGAIMERQFAQFDAQAKERVRIARQYGFDVIKIEARNAEDRLALTKSLLDAQVGSLQGLIKEMTAGDLFEGSAVDKRTAIIAEIAKAKGDFDAGKDGSAEVLADLYRQLNAVSKDVFGTTGGFAADRSAILDAAQATIAAANAKITAAAAATKSDPALSVTNAALDENNDQNAAMIAALGTANAQLAAMLANSGGLGSALIQQQLIALAGTSAA